MVASDNTSVLSVSMKDSAPWLPYQAAVRSFLASMMRIVPPTTLAAIMQHRPAASRSWPPGTFSWRDRSIAMRVNLKPNTGRDPSSIARKVLAAPFSWLCRA